MTDDGPTTVLLRARTAIEAQVVSALLRGEGITTYIKGAALADEFAVSQRLMGLQGVEIEVRHEDLERAQQLLAEARRTGQQLGDDAEPVPVALVEPAPPPAPSPRPPTIVAVIGWGLAVLFMFLWANGTGAIEYASTARGRSFWKTVVEPDGWRTVWKDTGKISSRYTDADHDGAAELAVHYTSAGWKRSAFWDTNENGRNERSEDYDSKGRRSAESVDADENGVSEDRTSFYLDGYVGTSHDEDQDGRAESRELRAPDGRLISEGRDADEDGFSDTSTTHFADGTSCTWSVLDADHVYNRCELRDASGALVRVQVRRGLHGFVDEK